MTPYELLRAAATIIETGWSQGADARDGTGRVVVPLFAGANRASVNPAAVAFSPYGAAHRPRSS
jgi:hypothetical protein